MKSKIALTIGDAAGIGPEISVKVAADKSITDIMDVVLVGPESVVEKAVKNATLIYVKNVSCNAVNISLLSTPLSFTALAKGSTRKAYRCSEKK